MNPQELHSQQCQNEFFASEEITLRAVMELKGGVMADKYVECYPGWCYYGGFDISDVVGVQTNICAKKLFGCSFVNVQPYSGAVGERNN